MKKLLLLLFFIVAVMMTGNIYPNDNSPPAGEIKSLVTLIPAEKELSSSQCYDVMPGLRLRPSHHLYLSTYNNGPGVIRKIDAMMCQNHLLFGFKTKLHYSTVMNSQWNQSDAENGGTNWYRVLKTVINSNFSLSV